MPRAASHRTAIFGFIIGLFLLLGQFRAEAHSRRHVTTSRYLMEDDDRHGVEVGEENASNGPVSGYSAVVSCVKYSYLMPVVKEDWIGN